MQLLVLFPEFEAQVEEVEGGVVTDSSWEAQHVDYSEVTGQELWVQLFDLVAVC